MKSEKGKRKEKNAVLVTSPSHGLYSRTTYEIKNSHVIVNHITDMILKLVLQLIYFLLDLQ